MNLTNPVIAALLERRTCRAFKKEQLDEATVSAILETGRYAATAMGRQPQHFTVVQSAELLASLVAATKRTFGRMNDERRQKAANDPDYDTYYGAPTVVFISSDPAENYGEVDCANSTQNMAVAAHSLGVGSCYIASVRLAFAGPEGPDLQKALGLPEKYVVQFALALGYPAQEAGAAAPRLDNVNWVR